MKLTIIGSAGSYPNASSPASSYLVEHDGARIVLDMGNGSFGALQQYIDTDAPDSLAGVVLSHCHIDHCADIGSLFVHRKYHPFRTFEPLPLYGPKIAAHRLAEIYGMEVDEMAEVFDIRPFAGEPISLGPFQIDTVRAAHPVEAYSMRVSAGGKALAFSGDTGPTPTLVEVAHDCAVALFEASNLGTGHPPDLHMNGAEAAQAATAAHADRLVLTHLAGWIDSALVLDEARPHFDGPIDLASPGLTLTV